MSKYEVEVQRASSDKHVKEISKLNGSVRVIGLNNLKSGDIVTIPAGYKSFEQEIAGSEYTAQFIVVNVKRGVQELALRFYPSSFTKMGTSVHDDYTRGEFVHANGNVVDHVQTFADVDEAVQSLVGRPFRVTLTPVKLVKYESRDKETLTKEDVNNTSLPTYEFEALNSDPGKSLNCLLSINH